MTRFGWRWRRAGRRAGARGGTCRLAAWAAAGLTLFPADAAEARNPPDLSGTLTCRRQSAPGRVICEVELELSRGRIAWADVVVVEAPELARPLRVRVSLSEARARTPRRVRLPLAFIATEEGAGDVVVAGRVVACTAASGSERCVPRLTDLSARLVVGPLG